MIRLLFIRHGATAGNLEKRYVGCTDEPLCQAGIAQAAALQRQFKADYLFVSPMKRTCQTAELVFPNQPYIVVNEFREIDFGMFEGKNAQELSENEAYRQWVGSFCKEPIPGGESVDAFKTRCSQAFLELVKKLPDQSTAAFVVHGGTIMAILEAYARPARDFFSYHIRNGETVSAYFEDGFLSLQS